MKTKRSPVELSAPRWAAPSRAKVFAIEEKMLEMRQVELRVEHYYSPGVYARELHIPAGILLTGRVHKYENMNILSQGEMSVSTEDGMKRIKAPCTVVSPPGTKRIALAHTDCVWTTILGTHETDPDVIDAHFTTNNEQEYLAHQNNLTIEG